MAKTTFYHGSQVLFDRPDPAFLGEGLTHSENGWGFYISDDKYTAGEHAGLDHRTEGVMYEYEMDENWIHDHILVSDRPVGDSLFSRITAAISQIARGAEILAALSPNSTGKDVYSRLETSAANPKTRKGAEFLAANGIKGMWNKGENALCLFDMDDVPESRINQVSGNFREGYEALSRQNLGDFTQLLPNTSTAFQAAFAKYAAMCGTGLDTATKMSDIPHGEGIFNALQWNSLSSLDSALTHITDPETRRVFGEMRNAFAPEGQQKKIHIVPEAEIDGLSLRQKIEYGYAKDGNFTNALCAVYATQDENLIKAVEAYAATTDMRPDARYDHTENAIANAINCALGSPPYSKPSDPDKMGKEINGLITIGTVKQDDPRFAIIENLREAMIDYGENLLGIPSQERAAKAEAEALAGARNKPDEMIARGEYMSENLGFAARAIGRSENPALQSAFGEVAKRLISDEYNAQGLPQNASRTYHQNVGYNLRDGLGTAIDRLLSDKGLDDDHFGGRNTWDRFKQFVHQNAGDDTRLLKSIDRLESSLADHLGCAVGQSVPTQRAKTGVEALREAGADLTTRKPVAAAGIIAQARQDNRYAPPQRGA